MSDWFNSIALLSKRARETGQRRLGAPHALARLSFQTHNFILRLSVCSLPPSALHSAPATTPCSMAVGQLGHALFGLLTGTMHFAVVGRGLSSQPSSSVIRGSPAVLIVFSCWVPGQCVFHKGILALTSRQHSGLKQGLFRKLN